MSLPFEGLREAKGYGKTPRYNIQTDKTHEQNGITYGKDFKDYNPAAWSFSMGLK